MHPILFSFSFITLYSYGLMVALAFLAGILVTVRYAQKEGIAAEQIFDLAILVIITSIVGARLFYVIGQWEIYSQNWLEIFMLQNGGLVFLGGFLFGLAGVIWFARRRKINFFKLGDAIAPGAALGIGIGRLGCFFNGCCFGLPTTLPWGIEFPFGSLAHVYYPNQAIHPTQLYASLGGFILFGIIAKLYQRKSYDGQIMFWWMIIYSVLRFIEEIFRYSPIHWLGLTPSQWIVIALVIGAVAWRKTQD